MTIEHINELDTLNAGRVKINDAIDASFNAEKTSLLAKLVADEAGVLSQSIQAQLDTLVIDGDSSVEAAQARVDDVGHIYPTLKDRLAGDNAKKVSVIGAEISNKSDKAEMSANMISQASIVSSLGWTGDFANGFTHVEGQTTPIIIDVPNLSTTKDYYISFTATSVGHVAPQDDFYVQIGGSGQFKTYVGTHASYEFEYGIMPINTSDKLMITPRAGWTGTIKNLQVKTMITASLPTLRILDSQNVLKSEYRSQGDNNFWGLNSGRKNTSGEKNTAFGDGSLQENTTGFWNSANGVNTLKGNKTGSRNVANGYRALESNIGGDRNIANGTFALLRNLYGSGNVAMGADALWHNIDGSQNIGIGTVAIGDNPNGQNLIGIGQDVMSYSSGGKDAIALGRRALAYNTGDGNIGVGAETLRFNKEGAGNTAVGHEALYTIPKSANNTVLGNKAMRNAPVGNDNVAVGISALYANRGTSNIGIGTETLRLNEGNYNIALGWRSGYESTSGSDTIGIGQSTLSKNKGDKNTAIGSFTMFNNETGTDNTVLGYEALRNNKDGQRNAIFGNGTARNVEGSNNVMMGFVTGNKLTTGDNNTFLGYAAAQLLQTGSNNIAIGYGANLGTNAENQLNIGNMIRGDISTKVTHLIKLKITELPTSKPSEPGMIWRDGDVLKVV